MELRRPRTSPRPTRCCGPPAPTVRVVRADFFSTKGQGFLYVEARTTKGAQTTPVVAMTLENDTGAGTAFVSPRTMSRFVDSGDYMFHRNLFKVDMNNPPKRIRVTSTIDGVTDGADDRQGLEVARRRHAAHGEPELQVRLRRRLQAPAAALRRASRRSPRQYPEIAEIVAMPNKTNGYQRKAQATIGSTTGTAAQSAVVVSSAAWGHEGGNGITVEMVNRPGADLPLAVEVNGSAVRVLLAKNAAGALASTAAQVAGRDRGGLAGPDRPRAPVPHQRGHGDRAGDDGAGRPHRLPRPEAHRRARGRGAARPVHDPRAADRQAPRRLQARRADPGVRPRP